MARNCRKTRSLKKWNIYFDQGKSRAVELSIIGPHIFETCLSPWQHDTALVLHCYAEQQLLRVAPERDTISKSCPQLSPETGSKATVLGYLLLNRHDPQIKLVSLSNFLSDKDVNWPLDQTNRKGKSLISMMKLSREKQIFGLKRHALFFFEFLQLGSFWNKIIDCGMNCLERLAYPHEPCQPCLSCS